MKRTQAMPKAAKRIKGSISATEQEKLSQGKGSSDEGEGKEEGSSDEGEGKGSYDEAEGNSDLVSSPRAQGKASNEINIQRDKDEVTFFFHIVWFTLPTCPVPEQQ